MEILLVIICVITVIVGLASVGTCLFILWLVQKFYTEIFKEKVISGRKEANQ